MMTCDVAEQSLVMPRQDLWATTGIHLHDQGFVLTNASFSPHLGFWALLALTSPWLILVFL